MKNNKLALQSVDDVSSFMVFLHFYMDYFKYKYINKHEVCKYWSVLSRNKHTHFHIKKWPLELKEQTYPVCYPSGQYGFDHHSGAFASYNTKTKARAVIQQVDRFHLGPFRV